MFYCHPRQAWNKQIIDSNIYDILFITTISNVPAISEPPLVLSIHGQNR